ncbi:hypothetical protein [Simkania negevensis]|uniref:Uncharacterized protein n=1 Tax=Simkania negevensis (strain ATCC VR-1471 / DSM 27360 / Z) TaxID=331113 RepID=F8L945_SIMNZ|nr:hypothetical protein [Simkania negevensis]CCB89360.1 unknown protein [Simkania negevensis Z]
MEGIDFALGGVGAFEGYNFEDSSEVEISFFDREPAYDAQVTQAMKNMQERVLQNHTQKHTLSTIDNVVKVKTLNAQVRQDKINFWQSRRAEMFTLGGASVIGLIGSAFLAASSGGILAGVLGVTSLVGSILGFYRGYQASNQMSQWSLDLPVAIATQRRLAFEEGLLHAMRLDATGKAHPCPFSSIMTSTEMQGMYNVYFHNLARSFERGGDVKEQLAIIQQVAVDGPLCPHVYGYAKLHPHHVTQLQFYIGEHDKFVNAFASIEKRRLDQEKQVKDKAHDQICTIEKHKNAALAVVNATYTSYKDQVDKEKSEALFGLSPEEIKVVSREFDQKLADARQLRDLGAAAISYPFQVQCEGVEKERDQYLTQIRYDRDAQLLPFYNHLRLLHTNAYRALIGQPPSAYPTLSDPYNLSFQPPVFTMPQPSAPSYEATFGGFRDRVDSRVYDAFMGAYRQQQHQKAS